MISNVTREKYLPAVCCDVVPLEKDEISPKVLGQPVLMLKEVVPVARPLNVGVIGQRDVGCERQDFMERVSFFRSSRAKDMSWYHEPPRGIFSPLSGCSGSGLASYSSSATKAKGCLSKHACVGTSPGATGHALISKCPL